ncbi:multidrug effflux MFS transporter [Paramicrobacterium agarici]|uniref:DHA1 family bicyclomycin/chloramphenicol resistance-like MFS transporter n=1 Tax=Paramicrobacterium agarici TaxID=630514 RepID=A0A2A9DX81_9MICO|nr:multidrug effflux MFS transporter [Microbacterium agarici]PFG30540.1 DHA1 family bicyclomycin/chloramphenicol resistance-like MFS transporter [Microbacterium agarici]
MTTVVHPGDSLSGRQRLVYVLVLGALTALGPFTIDLYLPAFPVLTEEFAVPDSVIQLTLTGTTIGFAVGQLFMGPWSDKVGRRLPLIIATSVHVFASLGASVATDVVTLMVFRVLQGAGAAAGGVVAMAMVRDLFGGKPLVRMLSRLALVNGLAPILAPVLGSQLLLWLPWRGLFWFLAVYGLIVVVCVAVFIIETLPKERRVGKGHGTVGERYKNVFGDRIFVGVALMGAMNFSGLFSYLSSSSFLFQEMYAMDAQQYGLLFGANSIGVVIGVQISSRLMRWYGPQWVLATTTIVQMLSAATMFILAFTGAGLIGILIPLFFYIMSCGFTFPAVQVLGLVNHGHEAGTAASLLGALNFGVAGLTSPIVGALGVSTQSMAGVMIATAAIAITALWIIVRPRSVPRLSD